MDNLLQPHIIAFSILTGVCLCLISLSYMLAIKLWKPQKSSHTGPLDPIDIKENDISIDSLTGMINRYGFIHEVDKTLATAKNINSRVAVLLVDLDDFKTVNEALGPSIGDCLLKAVGQRITEVQYTEDTICAHLGGDEFAILLPHCIEGSKNISTLANQLMYNISMPFQINNNEINISCSIGICVYPDCASTADALLKNASIARYDAKNLGRNIHVFYTKDMSNKAKERTLLTNDLRRALDQDELALVYQPKIYAKNSKIHGAEVLIRWHHPKRGVISPGIFIPLAEESGMIHSIGEWIIHKSCQAMQQLQNAGFTDLQLAVNLSSHQFDKGDIAGTIAEAMWKANLQPKALEFELTESMVMKNSDKSILMLKVLSSMGLNIAIDDFGTGYSSLSHLNKFPVSTLKIDQSFIHPIADNQDSLVIVSTIINLAKQLNLSVVAEGVETVEQFNLLKQQGCDIIQGYYFSKPLSLSLFEAFIKNHQPDP